MKKLLITAISLIFGLAAVSVNAQTSRDYISIVGSSTVYPFATVVAEQFGKTTRFKTPKIESTGSGGGLKLFCAGVGVQHPDITNASRRMKTSEFDKCQANGVLGVVEVRIGYDGIVMANSKRSAALKVSKKDIYLALAKHVPAPGGGNKLVENPYRTWKDVNPSLPNVKIEVLGPPPTSGTRDAFAELALEGGCKTFGFIKSMKKSNKSRYKAVCHSVREDGAYIEAGENDNLIVQKLQANPDAFGIFGFSFLDQNTDKIQGAYIGGVQPTFDAIASGAYPLSRSLQFYVKRAHVDVIPGIREYLDEFTSAKAWGPDGYLAEKGMIPMTAAERALYGNAVNNLKILKKSDL